MRTATKYLRRALLGLTLAAAFFAGSMAHAQVFSADAVKAAFLHRFASYVEWPADALGDGPFVIAVAAGDPVADHLDELLPQMNVQGRTATVRRAARVPELDGAHILYVGRSGLTQARELVEAARERPILLVTDGDRDFGGGGVINFVESDNRVRFEVSLAAADRAGLRIDSALLAVAARVERQPQAWLSPCAERSPGAYRYEDLITRARAVGGTP